MLQKNGLQQTRSDLKSILLLNIIFLEQMLPMTSIYMQLDYFRILIHHACREEKELKDFIGSLLQKTKLHQLIGDLESKYQDARASRPFVSN